MHRMLPTILVITLCTAAHLHRPSGTLADDASSSAESPAEATPPSTPADVKESDSPTEEQIATWVRELDSPKFAIRQSATKSLESANGAAVEVLKAAASTGSPEVASRAVDILGRIAVCGDDTAEMTAVAALDELVSAKQAKALNQATAALDSFRHLRQNDAIEKLREMGAQVNVIHSPLGIESVQVTVDTQWKGGDEGLAWLRRLPDLEGISLRQSEISDAAIDHLRTLKNLKNLQIYGTQITDTGALALQAALPAANFERRNGALLGIGGPISGTTGCSVSTVLEESAAAAADIRVGDVVVQVDGTKIESFQELQDLIGKRRPGEKVVMEIFREERLVTKEVILGKWQ